MAKFHIDENSRILKCKARFRPCPYDKHFYSLSEAQKYLRTQERIMIEAEINRRMVEENQKKIDRIEEERNILGKSFSDYYENIILKKYNSNDDYAYALDTFIGELSSKVIQTRWSHENKYGKKGLDTLMLKRENVILSELNDYHVEAMKDALVFMELPESEHWHADSKFNPNAFACIKNNIKIYDTMQSLGIDNTYNRKIQYYTSGFDAELSKKIKKNRDGYITNLWYIGESNFASFYNKNAGRVVQITYDENNKPVIHTEENPRGFTVYGKKISDLDGVERESKGYINNVFFLDETRSGEPYFKEPKNITTTDVEYITKYDLDPDKRMLRIGNRSVAKNDVWTLDEVNDWIKQKYNN